MPSHPLPPKPHAPPSSSSSPCSPRSPVATTHPRGAALESYTLCHNFKPKTIRISSEASPPATLNCPLNVLESSECYRFHVLRSDCVTQRLHASLHPLASLYNPLVYRRGRCPNPYKRLHSSISLSFLLSPVKLQPVNKSVLHSTS